MQAMDMNERVEQLERRVSELEGSLGFILPTLRQVHLDLLNFKDDTASNFETVNAKLDAMPAALAAVITERG